MQAACTNTCMHGRMHTHTHTQHTYVQWRIQAGVHPARTPPILPNDFTDPARPRPLFHSLFTKSCASINTFVSTLHKRLEGATAEVRQQGACLANHSVSICRTLYIQRSVILLREHRLAKQKWEAFSIRLVVSWFYFILFGTHHVHRITHESLIMTYFQCGPLMTCGGLEWEVESTTVTHSSADWWDLLLPLT